MGSGCRDRDKVNVYALKTVYLLSAAPRPLFTNLTENRNSTGYDRSCEQILATRDFKKMDSVFKTYL